MAASLAQNRRAGKAGGGRPQLLFYALHGDFQYQLAGFAGGFEEGVIVILGELVHGHVAFVCPRR
jgi:hypothetical protein